MGKYSDLFQIFTKLVNGRKKIYKKMTMSRETRLELYIDESRIWNMGMRNVKRNSYLLGFMWSDSIV